MTLHFLETIDFKLVFTEKELFIEELPKNIHGMDAQINDCK